MASWVLTLGLQNLRSQVNEAFPDRDKASDGTIGDTAHQAETSGHNRDDTSGSRPEWDGDPDSTPEVRAWDMDSDLRAAPATAQQIVDHIRHLPGVSSVLRYMIYNRKIYKASNDWAAEGYDGPSAHTEHIHFSGAYSQSADNNTTYDYRLEEIPVALTSADKTWIQNAIAEAFTAGKQADGVSITSDAGQVIWNQGIPNGVTGEKTMAWKAIQDLGEAVKALEGALTLDTKINDVASTVRTVGDNERDFAKLRGTLVLAPDREIQNKVMEPGSPLDRIVRAADAVLAAAPAKPTA